MRLVLQTERSQTNEERTRNLRKEFMELPFERKIATLVQLETIAVTEAFDAITDASVSFGKKIFDSVMPTAPATEGKQDQGAPKENKPV